MLTNVDMLTSAVCKSPSIVALDSLVSRHDPLSTKRPEIFKKTVPVHEQTE